MTLGHLAELLLLAALWGGSFLLMRLGAGEFGPVALSAVRVAMAAGVLLPILCWQRQGAALRQHWRAIAVVGVVNSTLPFLAYAYAATALTAGLSSVFNATTPLWGALIAWLWLRDRPDRARALGLAIGFGGVLWLVWDKAGFRPGADASSPTAAVLACVLATACYGFSASFTKRYLTGVPPMAVAAGSQTAAALALALPGYLWWPQQNPGPTAWWALLVLGLACTGLAYLLFFRLIANLGPARAISVTFLIPLFAVFWGWLVLDETVTSVMAGACSVILLGTALATGLLSPSKPTRGASADARP